MNDLKDAIQSLAGTSDLADELIRRRFGADLEHLGEATASADDPDFDYEDVLDDVISDDLDTSDPHVIRKLSIVVLRLLDRLSILESQGSEDSDEQEVDDEELDRQLGDFRRSLRGKRVGDLQIFYGRSLLSQMKKGTRYLVSRELVDYARSLNKEPDALWLDVVRNKGLIAGE